ncbi:hypothetical protein HB852_05695 [Listeria grandensis]|uniref:hypothetical protein n=1 Tax=Listeria grandensis TaxID=1494963 RepID=UPI00162467E9|nr:hypothetical protein [Listeria grandensis]MBC1474100.1 hypothetical protein [Listeria grandensis]
MKMRLWIGFLIGIMLIILSFIMYKKNIVPGMLSFVIAAAGGLFLGNVIPSMFGKNK